MSTTVELTVPDIGGYADVPVIEVLVQPGETIGAEAPLVTLESEKATMEVPASAGGVVKEIKVKVGDKVSQGSVIATVEVPDAVAPPPAVPAAPPTAAASTNAPVASSAPPGSNGASNGNAAGAAESVIELTVPDIGGYDGVPVIEVLVKPGDVIAKDAPLVTLESEKATMEVPASAGGTVTAIKVKVGDKVSQGSVLVTVSSSTAVPASSAAPAPPPAAHAPQAAPNAAPPQPASHSHPAQAAQIAAPPLPASYGTPGTNGAPANGSAATGTPVHGSPAIRRFARELGVDLAQVRGSGPNGRITRDDVQQFVKRTLSGGAGAPTAAPSGASLGLGLPPWPVVDFAKFGPIERTPLSRIQKISGPSLARNWIMIPHVTQNEDADVTELEAFRKQINGEQKDVKVTMLAFLIKASVATLKAFPNFNSSLDGDALVLKQYYHIGFAADTPGGLVVPVVRDADKKGIAEIARETSELAGKARDGKLRLDDMQGSTFTISSLGGIGGTSFTPIINAPEVAILGACRTTIRPVWNGSTFEPRTILPLSLSYDHRVIDGASAARFAVYLAKVLEDIRRTLM